MADLKKVFAAAEALNDQELAASVDWLNAHSDSQIMRFFDLINSGSPELVRSSSNERITIILSFALIGFHEAVMRQQKARE